jgi:hypothetical protein
VSSAAKAGSDLGVVWSEEPIVRTTPQPSPKISKAVEASKIDDSSKISDEATDDSGWKSYYNPDSLSDSQEIFTKFPELFSDAPAPTK